MKTRHCFSFAPIRRAAVSSLASALFLLAALCAPYAAKAAWQPGLLGGYLIGANNSLMNTNDVPQDQGRDMAPYLGPHVATNSMSGTSAVTDPWKHWQTWVYTGQIYLDGSTYAFAESIDDAVWLVIDGDEVLNDTGYNATTFGTITRAPGWYSFELRMFNGTGGAGPSNGQNNNWDTTKFGFGYNKIGATGQARPINIHFTYPEDDGSGKFFRHDDGTGFDDCLEVVGAPAGVSAAEPAFGSHRGFQENQTTNVCAAAFWVNAAGNVCAFPCGWEVYARGEDDSFALTNSGTGASFEYRHLDVMGRIVWNFTASNLLSSAAGANGSASGGGWCESSEFLKIEATAADGYMFYAWAGDVPAEMAYDNPLWLPGDMPRSVVAQFVPEVEGDVRHVAMDGNDLYDGISFATAKRTIQGAVDELGAGGGIVLVAPGVYETSVETVITTPVTVRGATRDAKDALLSNTVRSGNTPNSRIFNINHADARVEFLTISDGRVSGVNGENNGALSNASTGNGGNIYIGPAGGTVADCVVRNGYSAGNHNQHGGNISMNSASALVIRCVITNGVAYNNGGGAGVNMWAGRVENCFIAYNNDGFGTGNFGSAVRMRGASVLENCTIVRNAGNSGGAVNADHGSAIVRNCVIVDNYAPTTTDAAGSVFRSFSAQASRFENCVADVYINDNCFTTSAGFGFADAAAHDYRLTPLALALDAGMTPDSLSATDLAGNPRKVGAAFDAGCFEYQGNGAGGGGAFDFAFDAGALRRHAAPFEVAFTTAVVNAQGQVAYTWNFNDGTGLIETNAPSITHLFEMPKFYTVSVTAFDGVSTITKTYKDIVYAAPPLIYVTAGASAPLFPYDTPATALAAVAPAVAAAEDGTVIIISGAHTLSAEISIAKDVRLLGATGDPADAILRRGSANQRIMYLNHPNAFASGLTLENGYMKDVTGANLAIDSRGGAVSNCVIRGGTGDNWHARGGGVWLNSDNALATHCVITNNSVNQIGGNDKGGGVHVVKGVLAHSLIAGNKGPDAGGTGDRIAGGVYIENGLIENCTIAGNTKAQYGGVYVKGGTIRNTVIAGNTSNVIAGDAAAWGVNLPALTNAFVKCAIDTTAPNTNCFHATSGALMVNISGGDFHPAALSKLIDAGEPLANPPAADLDGNQRVQGDRIDIGCYEADASAFSVSFESDIQEGIVPKEITFTASVGGADAGDVIKYIWDFNGDGTIDAETYLPTVTHEYSLGGTFTVSLAVTNQTTDATASAETEDYIHVSQKIVYVAAGNENAALPYASIGTAAPDIQTAIAAAVDGCEIIIGDGWYNVWEAIIIKKSLFIHSETGEPESVIINSDGISDSNVGNPLLHIQNAGAWISGVTIQNGQSRRTGANIHFDTLGGTVSNCVIRGGRSFQHEGNGAAAQLHSENALLTHCVITNNYVELRGDVLDKSILSIKGGRIENCLIARNYGIPPFDHTASVIDIQGGIVRNCTIVTNDTVTRGVIYFSGANGAIANCVIAGNAENGVFWSGDPTGVNRITDCTIDEENLNATCRYAPAKKIFSNFAAGNYQLGNDSPAIDAGILLSPAAAASAGIDLQGRARAINGHIDDGCYESLGRATMLIIR